MYCKESQRGVCPSHFLCKATSIFETQRHRLFISKHLQHHWRCLLVVCSCRHVCVCSVFRCVQACAGVCRRVQVCASHHSLRALLFVRRAAVLVRVALRGGGRPSGGGRPPLVFHLSRVEDSFESHCNSFTILVLHRFICETL